MKNFIVMGVTGSGKSTIGKSLAQNLHIPFFDGDDFHPPQNIEKMKNGIPLTDDDRKPWLLRLRKLLTQYSGCVIACSALKRSYRKLLDGHNEQFIYLQIDKEEVIRRLGQRDGHFMPSSLINSQFSTLEVPTDAWVVNAKDPMESVVNSLLIKVQSQK